MAVQLLADQDRYRATETFDLVGGRRDDEAAAAIGADQQAGEALCPEEGREVGGEIAPGRGLNLVFWLVLRFAILHKWRELLSEKQNHKALSRGRWVAVARPGAILILFDREMASRCREARGQ